MDLVRRLMITRTMKSDDDRWKVVSLPFFFFSRINKSHVLIPGVVFDDGYYSSSLIPNLYFLVFAHLFTYLFM